jgi:hypothetical protein
MGVATASNIAIVALLVTLVAVVWALMRTRKAARSAVQAASSSHSQSYIEVFEADTVYRLVAHNSVTINGTEKSFGLVERQDGSIIAYLMANAPDLVAVGDCFVSVRGHIARIGAEAFSAPASNIASQASESPQRQVPETAEGSAPKRMIPRPVEEEAPQRMIPRSEEDTIPQRMIPDAEGDSVAQEMIADDEEPTTPSIADDEFSFDLDAAEDDLDKTQMFLPGTGVDLARVDENAGLTFLRCLVGKDQDTLFHLPFALASIGRGEDATITLKDPASSRIHCKIVFENHNFVLRDNGSTNGTFRNDERVEQCVLEFGDRIKVANTELVFGCEGYDQRDENPSAAIAAFEACLAVQPDFLGALKILAFLMEKDVALQSRAQPLWKQIAQLEKSQ